MKYKAKEGSHISDLDAEKIGPILDELCDKGICTPDEIVRIASDPKSVLHDFFDWSDSSAACKWRKQQARMIVNVVTTVLVDKQGRETECSGYESVPVVVIEDDIPITYRMYQRTSVILADPEKWDLLRMEIRRDLKSVQRKLRSYEGLATSDQMKLIDTAVEAF